LAYENSVLIGVAGQKLPTDLPGVIAPQPNSCQPISPPRYALPNRLAAYPRGTTPQVCGAATTSWEIPEGASRHRKGGALVDAGWLDG